MSKRLWVCGVFLLAVMFALNDPLISKGAQRTRKIVLIAGMKSHGPGVHEYLKSVKLLKVMLDESPNLGNVKTEIHFNGWPEDSRTLDTADSIVTISDGQDGDRYSPVPFMTEARMPVIEKQMRRGCGFVTIHFSTFAPDKYGPQILEWGGGYFDWQGDDGKRTWYSAIKTLNAEVEPGQPNHPIANGVAPFQIEEEFYYRIRFRENDPRLVPILRVPDLAKDPQDQVVAWAVQRQDAGRGFGTTMGHFYRNWENTDYRKLMLNAIVWTADQGVQVILEGHKASVLEGNQAAQATFRVDLPNNPCLRVCKVASTPSAKPGEEIEFTIRFDNVGDQVIGNVTIVDNLTTRLEYVEGTGQSSKNAAFSTQANQGGSLVLRWELADPLKPGDGGIARFKCRVR